MSNISEWAVEHVDNIENAVEEGATDLDQVVQYCLEQMNMVDIPYVEEYLKENWDRYGCKDWNREDLELKSPTAVYQRSINATIKARRLIFGANE